jgi:hypothetical protein
MARHREPEFGGEPPLDDLLDDPVTHAVMARDGVARAALDALIFQVQRDLRRRDARTDRRTDR